MTFYGQQFLYVADVLGAPTELINGARTSRRMISQAGLPFTNPTPNGGCDVLTLEPCTTTVSGGTTLVRTSWAAVDFAVTAAPWYKAAVPASSEAVGFFIEEWTGLDGSHRARAITPVGWQRGGARIGQLSHAHRVMKLNVLLHASSERGLNYLFRWLEQQLIDCCTPGGAARTIWYRESCPLMSAPEEGLIQINNVGLIDGPTWESQPTDRSGCYVRRCSFTLAAGDPCLYANDVDVTSGNSDISGVSLSALQTVANSGVWAGTNRRISAQMPAAKVGRVAPIVTISSTLEVRTGGVRKPLPDLRITGYLDPAGDGLNPSVDYPIAEMVIAGSASSGLVIEANFATRMVRYRDPNADNQWYDGSRFIATARSGAIGKRWISFDSCQSGWVVVEPQFVGLASTYDASADPVSGWSVDVNAVEFQGCC